MSDEKCCANCMFCTNDGETKHGDFQNTYFCTMNDCHVFPHLNDLGELSMCEDYRNKNDSPKCCATCTHAKEQPHFIICRFSPSIHFGCDATACKHYKQSHNWIKKCNQWRDDEHECDYYKNFVKGKNG